MAYSLNKFLCVALVFLAAIGANGVLARPAAAAWSDVKLLPAYLREQGY